MLRCYNPLTSTIRTNKLGSYIKSYKSDRHNNLWTLFRGHTGRNKISENPNYELSPWQRNLKAVRILHNP